LKTVLSCFSGCKPLKKSTRPRKELFLPARDNTSLSKLCIQKENLTLGYFFQYFFWRFWTKLYISSSGYGLNSKLNSHTSSQLKLFSTLDIK
jgi:hypothetical protein